MATKSSWIRRMDKMYVPSNIAKTRRSPLIRHRPDANMYRRYLIDIYPKAFACDAVSTLILPDQLPISTCTFSLIRHLNWFH